MADGRHDERGDAARAEEPAALSLVRARVGDLLLSSAPLGIVAFGADLRVVFANSAVAKLIGSTTTDVIGVSGLDLVHPDDLEMAVDSLGALLDDDRPALPSVVRVRTAQGTYRSLEAWVQVVDRQGGDISFVMTLRDASSALEIDEFIHAMLRSEALAPSLRSLTRAIAGYGPFYASVHWDWDGERFGDLVADRTDIAALAGAPDVAAVLGEALRSGAFDLTLGTSGHRELAARAEAYGVRSVYVAPIHPQGARPGVIATWYPFVTSLGPATRRLCERMATLANLAIVRHTADVDLRTRASTDSLTRVANRASFLATVSALIDEGHPCAVLLLDLDGFKAINDAYGHLVGDQVLMALASRLVSATRPNDVVARLGGDEFALLLHGAFAPAELDAAAQRLAAGIADPVSTELGLLEFGVSVGVAASAGHGSAVSLIAAADRAMYEVKRNRKAATGVPRTSVPSSDSSPSDASAG